MPVAEKHQGDGLRAGPHLPAWAPPLLLLLFVVAIYWKLVFTDQYTLHDAQDHAWQILPWYQFQAREWHAGRFPLWDPYEWGGQPVLGEMLTGAAYPLNWMLSLAPLRDGWIRQDVLHGYFVLIHYMGALFCYLLLRDLGRSPAASLLAAAAFGTGGFFGSVGWPQMLNGAVWAPLVFLFFFRWLRGQLPLRSAALAGTFLGVSFLSGHHQVPTFVGLSVVLISLYGIAAARRQTRDPLVRALAVFALFAFLASALQTLPAYEFGRLAVRWVSAAHPVGWREPVPYYVHAEYSLRPLALLGILFPGVPGGNLPFMGWIAVSLAIFALAACWQERAVKLGAAIALGGVVFALGGSTVFQGLLYALVPLVEKARSPSMAILMYHLGVSILCAYGLDAFADPARRAQTLWTRRLPRGLLALAAGTGLLLLLGALVRPEPSAESNRLALLALAGGGTALVLWRWAGEALSGRGAVTALLLILLVELGTVTAAALPPREKGWPLIEALGKHSDIADFLRRQPGPVRIEVDNQAIPYNFGDWHGIDAFEAYVVGLSRNVERVREYPAARRLLAINYSIGPKPLRPDQVEVYASPATGLKVYTNPGAFPRVWSVHEAAGVAHEQEIAKEFAAPLAVLERREFQFGTPPRLETCTGADDVRLVSRSTDGLVIDANLQCRGMVVAAETYFPGWAATVDGTPAPLHEAYTMLRGVVVERGRHRIEMRYRPRSVSWGAALTAAGLLGAALLAWPGAPRRRSAA